MKTILITGGATGLGNELAKLYVQNGDQVILLGRNEDKLNKAQEALGRSCIATVSADLTNYEELTQKMDSLLSLHSVDVLINNAGMGHFGPLTSYTKEMIDEVINTNVKGTIYLTQSLLPHLQTREQATILTIISTAGLRGKKNESVYVASKFALRGFVESLKVECEHTSVSCTAAYMGGMDTPFWDNSNHIADKSRLKHPSEVASIIFNQRMTKEDIMV